MKEREQTTIRLPVELKEQLQQEADKRGFSFNVFSDRRSDLQGSQVIHRSNRQGQ